MPGTRPRIALRCRTVVDNDFSGDPDGLVGLAHHLLSPGNRVVAVTSSFINPEFPTPEPRAADGAALASALVALLGAGVPVHAGAEVAFDPGRRPSPAARVIVAEALRNDPLPLVVACGGPLTNVAEAIVAEPAVADRIQLAWIGGSTSGGFEYNRDTDPAAAEFVLSRPGLRIEQFPQQAYRQCAMTITDLEDGLACCGELGSWLWERFCSPPEWVEIGEVWPLGDSPLVLSTALGTESSVLGPVDASGLHQMITHVDVRLLFDDMWAKFRRHAAGTGVVEGAR